MPGFTNVFKSLQIRLPWDKYACQSYLSRFQFSFHISWSTCAARAPYWLRGMWSHDTSWCICSVKGKNPDRNGHEAKIRGTAGSMFQMCVHELIGASVVCYAEGWRDGGKGGGGMKMLASPSSIGGIIIWPLRNRRMQQCAAYGSFFFFSIKKSLAIFVRANKLASKAGC